MTDNKVSSCSDNTEKVRVEYTRDFEDIKAAMQKAAQDGKMSCTVARGLADELGVAPREIGQAADDMKIKIFGCELGCF